MKISTNGFLKEQERVKWGIERVAGYVLGSPVGYRYVYSKDIQTKQPAYAFYNVTFRKLSDHYIIEEEWRNKQYRSKLGMKSINFRASEILELRVGVDEADKRCLEILLARVNIDKSQFNFFRESEEFQ